MVTHVKLNISTSSEPESRKVTHDAVIGKGRGHGTFDTYSFVILCRCPIQKLKGP
jgi:hypothetical protein